MPELPEVEHFRQILLPFVTSRNDDTKNHRLKLSLVNQNPPKKWLTSDDVEALSGKCYCADVRRKGKQLCMALNVVNDDDEIIQIRYLYLHMGMTGQIMAPNKSCSWGLKNVKIDKSGDFPPKYSYLLFETAQYKASFSDSRKFGSCFLSDDLDCFHELAPDALLADGTIVQDQIIPGLTNQSISIKALLLDQKRVISGVGNWVADEVLYQCQLHPDQKYLTPEQAHGLFSQLQSILAEAVDCLNKDQDYPDHWLFGYRWTKKKQGSDSLGRQLTFLTSGGRTSAIVTSVQKLRKSPSGLTITKPGATKKPQATVVHDAKRHKTKNAVESGNVTAADSNSDTASTRPLSSSSSDDDCKHSTRKRKSPPNPNYKAVMPSPAIIRRRSPRFRQK